MSEVLEDGSTEKPRTGSLFKTMSLETLTLEDALRLLSLPRVLTAPDGEEIQVANGRYGPYIKKGSETRSLTDEEQLFTVTVEEATAMLAQPKERRGRGQAKPPLKDLGPDPTTGQADRRQGRTVRPVRDRRRDEREPPARRRAGEPDDGSGARAARRATREGACSEEAPLDRQALACLRRASGTRGRRRSTIVRGTGRRPAVPMDR